MQYLEPVDSTHPAFGDLYDELPLWSAPFGLLLLERVPLRLGLTILDVGAGTGFLTVELAQRCGPQATVIAVDPWEAGMRRLQRKIEHLGIENVRLIEHDAVELDLPDASIDVVVSNLGINNFANADAVLRTCFRVTKPGGRLLLTTNLVGHMREFYDVYRATLMELELADRLATLDAHINHRATLASVAAQLAHAGFELLTVQRLQRGHQNQRRKRFPPEAVGKGATDGNPRIRAAEQGWPSSRPGCPWCCLRPWRGRLPCSSGNSMRLQQSAASSH